MSRKTTTSIVAAGLSVLLAVTSLTARSPYADSRSPWGANYFPNVPLVTQDGKTVHFYSDLLKGKVVVINFIYTKCADSCPMETAKLAQVQRLLGDRVGRDVFFYSISIDTERDSPTELKAYADKFHVKPGWLFLTGEKADVEQVRKKLGQAARPGENGLTAHSTTITIGNEETGQWMQASSMDDTTAMAVRISDWLSSWHHQIASKSYTEANVVDADNGSFLFRTRCSACHTIGHGDSVGPDLLGVTNTRDHAWLSRFIAAPDKLLADKDPIATALYAKYNQVQMPNLRLSGPDVDALIAFLDAQTAKAHAHPISGCAASNTGPAKDKDCAKPSQAGS
jgi:protein SCO1/2